MFEESDYRLPHFICHRRKELAITQQQLASLINVSVDYIVSLEAGDRQLDYDRIDPLADALAVDRTWLSIIAVVERTPPIVRDGFWGPMLAEMAKGGDA